MRLKIFIDRPILSMVISVVIVLLGLLALKSLPVEQYPDIAPPTVNVYASYPGANAETVQKAVIVPLEEEINGVEDMIYMTSTASNSGDASIDIYFKQGTNADMAAVNVQNRVSTALGVLPAEVTQTGVTATKQQKGELNTIAVYSPEDRYDAKFIDNYTKINIEPLLKRIGGVGNVSNYCAQYSIRIWLDPAKMAQYKLIPSDIEAVMASQNIEAATGEFGENYPGAFQYSMKYRGRKTMPEEFENLVIKALPDGDVLKLKDVARIELGSEMYNFSSLVNGHPASIISCYQTAGSNASATIREINAVLDEVKQSLPEGLEIVTLTDTNRFLNASIKEVVKALIMAILLVVLVVYVFLQDIRSTLIPTLSIVVSIVGTFLFMPLLGFSINLLTLFALVLAIGTVVDDAIVVVEAVQARFDSGYRSSYLAANDAMSGISAAILVSTLIFMAVFVPVSMLGGTSGIFYKQFGLTMAVAVGISALNAFTLSPALCSLMLRPYLDENGKETDNFAARFRKAFGAVFNALSDKYMRGVMFFLRRKWLVCSTIVVGISLLFIMVKATKTGFIPEEDIGTLELSMNSSPGTSMDRMTELSGKVWDRIGELPEIEHVGGITGFSFSGSGPSHAMAFISLRDWSERVGSDHNAEAVMEKVNALAAEERDLTSFASMPSMIPGYGSSSSLELYLQDRKGSDIEDFKAISDKFVEQLSLRPEFEEVYSAFETNYPQYWVDIDAAKCEQAGVSTGDILNTLSMYYGGAYVSNFNRFSKLYRVMLQAEPSSRISPESLEGFYVRVGEEMAPISHFVTLTKTYGPNDLSRFNLYNAISINATAARGYSSGEAIKAVKETAAEVLPTGYSYEYGGMTREEEASSGNIGTIFALCLILIYLILCALYESIFLPFAIILAVPCGLAGSFFFTWALGLENNIYLQTGVVMLIGLLAKTAILLTDYAGQNRRGGMGLALSAITAARVRLRPILMTALTMVFGMLPLLFASGVGANGSRSLATGAVGGMLVGTLVLLFIVPSLFIVFQWVHERVTFLTPKKMIKGAVVTLFLFTLHGCGLYTKYTPQKASNADSLFRHEVKDTNSIASLHWEKYFTDPILQRLIREGIENNKDLAIAHLKTEEASATLQASKLAYLPSLSISADGNVSKQFDAEAGKNYSIGALASWEIDAFGKITNSKRMAAESYSAQMAYAQAVQSQLVATIAESYYNLLALDAGLDIYNETLQSWAETVQTLEALTKAGRANEVAVLQAKANMMSVEQSVNQTRKDVAVCENALSVLLGRSPGRIERSSIDSQYFSGAETGLPIEMLRRRPDVREAEHALAAAYYSTNVARSKFYPSLSLSGSLGFTNGSGGVELNPGMWLLNAAGNLLQPLFNNGQNTANLKIAKAQQEEALLAWQKVVLNAGKEVNDALASNQAASQNITSATEQEELLKTAVHKAELLMRHSSANYLEVLTAEQALLSARSAKLQYRLQLLESFVNLYHALGGGI